MTQGDIALRSAAALMAHRLNVFRRLAENAKEAGIRVNLAPAELWELDDQAALSAYEDALNQINGAQPLPFESVS
jgi:hypothetical protein